VHLPQAELSVESLEATVNELRARPAILMNMAQAAVLRGRPTAAADIARQLLSLVLA
jgi:UDP-N-acetylglucosamine:LPS N-acetylglucosamine transferase